MEIQAKALRDLLGEVCPGKQFFPRRSEGTIFVDRRPLVAVQVQSQDESRLSWKHGKRVALAIDDKDVEMRFKALVSEGGEPWS